MDCPVCKTERLSMMERQGIEIDYCPKCRGVWLDHPSHAYLVIEVAETTLRTDLGLKRVLYALGGVAEYWVVDLKARSTVVHRVPRRGKYTSVRRVAWSAVLT